MSKPILCVDFDGVLHSYTSGWQGADVVTDPPVPGAARFLIEASKHFRVCIYSSRSKDPGGIAAMQKWLIKNMGYPECFAELEFPTQKPAAFLTIDDRAICFEGTFPEDVADLLKFQPWNKRT